MKCSRRSYRRPPRSYPHEHPQPVPPASFTSASLTQQASTIADDGIGMPADQVRGHGIGLELVPVLAKMARGEFVMEQRSVGTAGLLIFSVPDSSHGSGKPH